MKKIFEIAKKIIGDFIINPFWKSWQSLILIGLSFIANGLLWYFFIAKVKSNPMPFVFASGVVLLNLILANYLWTRDQLISQYLLGITLFTQILMLIFIRSFLLFNI